MIKKITLLLILTLISACTSTNTSTNTNTNTNTKASTNLSTGTDIAKHDGNFLPGDGLPTDHSVDIASVQNATPQIETLSKTGNKPYQVYGKLYVPLKSNKGYQAKGLASWYGTKFHGRKTSSGEPYNMYEMSAAHRTLPLPSYAKVTNLANQRSVIVKVNDRGPFIDPEKRIMDVSYAAAVKLKMIATGTAKIKIEAINLTSSASQIELAEKLESEQRSKDNNSFLQMGAFSVQDNAANLLKCLNQIGIEAYIEQDQQLYKIKSGPYLSLEDAMQLKYDINKQLNIDSQIVFN